MPESLKKIRIYVPLHFIVSITGAILAVILLLAMYAYSNREVATPEPKPVVSAVVFPKPLTLSDNRIDAKAAVLFDPTTGKVLYAKNADLTMPLASLTKLMTAQVALSNLPPATLITLTQKDVSVEGDAGDWNLKAGDTMTLGSIIKLGLGASSNHAMSAAAAALGASYVHDLNKAAGQLGLSHTYFLNPTGLDVNANTSGAYGSAYDVARLAAVFMQQYPTYFEQSTRSSVTVPVSTGANNHQVTADATALPILDIPGLIGVKTGYTDLAGGNLVVAFDADINHPLIAVVLGSSEEGRFDDMRTIINATRAAQQE